MFSHGKPYSHFPGEGGEHDRVLQLCRSVHRDAVKGDLRGTNVHLPEYRQVRPKHENHPEAGLLVASPRSLGMNSGAGGVGRRGLVQVGGEEGGAAEFMKLFAPLFCFMF